MELVGGVSFPHKGIEGIFPRSRKEKRVKENKAVLDRKERN